MSAAHSSISPAHPPTHIHPELYSYGRSEKRSRRSSFLLRKREKRVRQAVGIGTCFSFHGRCETAAPTPTRPAEGLYSRSLRANLGACLSEIQCIDLLGWHDGSVVCAFPAHNTSACIF